MYKYFLETFPKKTAPMTIQIIEKAAGEMRYELIDFIFGATRLTDYIRRSAVTLFLQCAKPAISGGKAVCDNLAAKHLDVLCSDSRVLEIASKKGWSDTVNALLLAAKKGDKELQFGDSLKFAVKNGHEQTASVLIKHGASKGSIESSVLNRLSKVKRARIEEMLR
jgi:hypothetical protein